MVSINVKEGLKYVGISAFISFPYDIRYVNLMRAQPDRYWHSTDKCWEIPYTNISLVLDKLQEEDYKITVDSHIQSKLENTLDIQIPETYTFITKPFQHQTEGIEYGLNHKKFLLADEQGCIDGDMEISYNVCGAGHKSTLAKLYKSYQKSSIKHKFKVRCLKDGVFGLNDVLDIVYSGKKPVYKVTLENGKFVNATADHEILTKEGFVAIEHLTSNSIVVTNGDTLTCVCCGQAKSNIITSKYAKFYGYCYDCMYLNRDGTKYKGDEIGKRIEDDGYVYMFGKPLRTHPRYTPSGLLEHIYIMEQHIGRHLLPGEQVHHINHIRHDNRLENLQLVTQREHALIHRCEKHLQKDHVHANGNEVIVIPKYTKVSSVEYVGIKDTYDIKMADPYHNFVANKVVVHNCGKTKQMIDLACINKQLYDYEHCLIIACVNGLKYNWQEEIGIHSNESGYILGTRHTRSGKCYIGSNKDRLYDLQHLENINDYFIITNIETLRYTEVTKVPCKTKGKGGVTRYKKVTKFPIVEELQKLIHKGNISMIVADEIHKCLAGNTLILTNRGNMTIKDIVQQQDPNIKIGTFTKDNKLDYVTPAKYFVNPITKNMLQLDIETKEGIKTVVCTPNHKFLTKNRGYVEACNLTSDDILEELTNDMVIEAV